MSENGLRERITNYLSHGGLFNPEHMEHEKVRALLMECRDTLAGTYLSGVSGTTAEDKTSMATARTLTGLLEQLEDRAIQRVTGGWWACVLCGVKVDGPGEVPHHHFVSCPIRTLTALTSGDGSESAGLREGLLAKCDELDSRAKAFEDNNQYYFRGVGEGFATAAKEFRALAALAPAISRPPTQGVEPDELGYTPEGHPTPAQHEKNMREFDEPSLPPSRAGLGGDRIWNEYVENECDCGQNGEYCEFHDKLPDLISKIEATGTPQPLAKWLAARQIAFQMGAYAAQQSIEQWHICCPERTGAIAEGQQSSKLVDKTPSASPGERE